MVSSLLLCHCCRSKRIKLFAVVSNPFYRNGTDKRPIIFKKCTFSFCLFAASNEEALLQSALAMSVDPSPMPGFNPDNFANMTEEQQIAYALQMSLADADKDAMEVEPTPPSSGQRTQVNHASLAQYFVYWNLR